MGLRGAIAVSVLAGGVTAATLAGPANATDDITQNAVGTYDAAYPWGTVTWVITPCQDDIPQCVHVAEYGAGDTERKYPGWSGNAYWQVGWWMALGIETPNALTCENGSTHSLPMNYTWDAATNRGLRSYREPGICTGSAYSGANKLTLTKVGPPPPNAG